MDKPETARATDRPGEHGNAPSRAVLEAVRRREPEALEALFEYGFDRIYALAARLLGDRAAAQDAIQEVFLKVYRSAHRIDPDRDPLPWLRQIAVNVCRDRWRSAGGGVRGASVSLDANPGLDATLPSPAPDPEADALAAERAALVRGAIDELPDQLREVVILRDWEGLDHDTIAALLGASGAAVRKRYSRALARLGELLEGELR